MHWEQDDEMKLYDVMMSFCLLDIFHNIHNATRCQATPSVPLSMSWFDLKFCACYFSVERERRSLSGAKDFNCCKFVASLMVNRKCIESLGMYESMHRICEEIAERIRALSLLLLSFSFTWDAHFYLMYFSTSSLFIFCLLSSSL